MGTVHSLILLDLDLLQPSTAKIPQIPELLDNHRHHHGMQHDIL